jgi:TPR repeat protein
MKVVRSPIWVRPSSAAQRGVPEAQRHVGYRRLVGRGVERDEAVALR